MDVKVLTSGDRSGRRNAYYRETRAEAAESNIKNLKTISTAAVALIIFCYILTPIVVKDWNLRIQHVMFLPALLACLAAAWIYIRKKNKNYWVVFFLCLIFDAIILSFCMAVDVFASYTTLASYMPMMYIVLPTLFIIPQKYIYAMLSATELLYLIMENHFKVPEVAQYDIFNSIVGFVFSVVIIQIILNLRLKDYRLRQRYQDLSTRDALSGMLNKEFFREAVDEYLDTKGMRTPHAMCIVDMDDFKLINDNYGHNMGDKLLQLEGRILSETFRSTDILGRFGGDEYVVFIKDTADRKVLSEKADLIQTKLQQRASEELSVETSCSIGFVTAEAGKHSYDELFEFADRALYQAKNNGKKTYRIVGYKEKNG